MSSALSILQKEPSIALQLNIPYPHNMPNAKSHDRAISKRHSKRMPQPILHVIIYGARRLFESIGIFAAECHYYLQEPRNCDRNVEYCNPHRLSPEQEQHVFTHDLERSVDQDNPHANRLYLDRNPIDAFTDASQCSTLPETKTPLGLKTRLYPYVNPFHIRRILENS